MMKRRHFLICSIIAMLSIVSYACETEYAICEGCEITSDKSGNEQTQTCKDGAQRCAQNLKSNESCKNGNWEGGEKCTYCFNENTSNEGVKEVGCSKCTPNSYDESRTEVCYKGAFKKLESKEISDGDSTSSVVLNPESAGKDALWELALKISDDARSYYNCHNKSVLETVRKSDFKNISDGEVREVYGCCVNNDYYIKRTGYGYYSVEKCEKVEVDGILATFMAYKYTEELNDSLIGQKQKLPYGFCHEEDLFLAVNDNDAKSVYHRYECESGSKCNSNYEGLCILDDVSIDGKASFMCETAPNSMKKTAFVIKSGDDIIATCPTKTVLKIKDDNGKWKDVNCGSQTFTLDKVRCAPMKSSYDGITSTPKS